MNQIYFEYHDEKKEQVSYEYDSRVSRLDSVQVFDGNIGRVSSRSTFGTYTGFTPELRKHFAGLEVSKAMGLDKGTFS